jgi:tetratricopeptide (TPR) repeat protein
MGRALNITFLISALIFSSLACNTAQNKKGESIDEQLAKAAVTSPQSSSSESENVIPPSRDLASASGSKTVIDPEFLRSQADYHFSLAEAHSLEGDSKLAADEYKLTLIYDPKSSHVRMKLAMELVKKGELVQAIDQAEAAVQTSPELVSTHLLLAGLYSSNKLYGKAVEQYQSALTVDPENTEAALYIGAILAEEKKYDESISYFKKITNIKKQQHLVYYYMGRVELEQKHEKNAETDFKKALSIKPDFTEGALALGYMYEQEKKSDLATKTYKNFQESQGPSSKIASNLARLYLEADKYTEAYKQFEIIDKQEPDNLNVKVKMALILIEQKKYEIAVEKLKNILTLVPDSEKIRFYLAAVYEELKEFPEAIEQFAKIKPDSSLYGESIVHTAYLQKTLGSQTKALETMSTAISLRSDIAQFYSFYASLLDEQKQSEKALATLASGVKKFPKDDQLYFYLGSFQDKLGMRSDCVKTMRKVLDLNPDHIQALNYLGYTLADMNDHLDEAENFVRHALKLKPNDGYITDSLGWVLFRRGQVKEAIETLESAYKIKPDESIIAEHLGDAYLRFSLRNKARQMYLRAVRLESDAANKSKLQQKIANLEHPLDHSTSQMETTAAPNPREPSSN